MRHFEVIGSKKRACEMMELSMSSYYYDPKITRAEKEEWEASIHRRTEQVVDQVLTARLRTALVLERGGTLRVEKWDDFGPEAFIPFKAGQRLKKLFPGFPVSADSLPGSMIAPESDL